MSASFTTPPNGLTSIYRVSRWTFGALLTVGVLLASSSYATLRRSPGGWLFGPRAVWTDGTTTPMFHPLSESMSSAGLLNARVSIEMGEDSGSCKMRPALRYSDDGGITWGTVAYVVSATYLTTNGITYGTAYSDLAGQETPKPWIQFGVQVANENAGDIQHCNATLLVEPKEK